MSKKSSKFSKPKNKPISFKISTKVRKNYENTKMKTGVVYPELSYKVVGCLFEVFKEIGFGHRERYYQNAVGEEFTRENIPFKKELILPLEYKTKAVGRVILDFLIDGKIVLELKAGNFFKKENIEQIYSYLKANNLKLGIIANFTKDGVKFKRILNIK